MKSLSTIQVLFAISILTAVLVGALFSFNIAIVQTHQKQAHDIKKQAEIAVVQNQQIEDILNRQINETVVRSESAAEERKTAINLTEDVKRILEQQGNLTKEGREHLIEVLQDNAELIPLIFPLVLDIDEDVEQLKTSHNITKGAPGDHLVITFNGTHVLIENKNSTSIIKIPWADEFPELNITEVQK